VGKAIVKRKKEKGKRKKEKGKSEKSRIWAIAKSCLSSSPRKRGSIQPTFLEWITP
jgi:hypothetical protein